MTHLNLDDDWTLVLGGDLVPAGLRRPVPATVPGVVHTDLMAADLIPDPYLGTNEETVQWIAETDATYSTVFDWVDTGDDRVDLVAEGLDTVATITLNGTEVARTRNQHRSYRFDVRDLLTPTGNHLEIAFDAPLRAARESAARIDAKPLVGDALPYNALRKMACNFGWDWGPTLTTAGIWRPIGLHAWSTARIAQAVPQVRVDESGNGTVEVAVDLERVGDGDVTLALRMTAPDGTVVVDQGPVVVDGATAALRAVIPHPDLWWPRGHGDQPLYRTEVRLLAGAHELDSWERSLGFRTVELRMDADEVGTSFEFRINAKPIWVRGANWIPLDCFPSRLTPEDYARGVRDVVEADMNMIRVWGGGLYESDLLYDMCDREGVLVWQDFLFACAMYSEEPELWDEVEAEARENVARLAAHPSLVMWNGSNENIEGYHHWGFKEKLQPGEAWGRGYYEDLLPRVLAEVDGTRPYIPSSPWNPVDDARPTDPDSGPVHSWKVWFTQDYLTYRDAIPRFVAEFGFQAPAAHSTLIPAVQDAVLAPDSPGMAVHQKSIDGNHKLSRGWTGHLPEPTTFDDWYFTTQLAQVRAITTAVAHYRSQAPRNSGYIVWQLNDCWPAVSWALVDSAGKRKPLWYALRTLNAPRVLLLQPRADGVALIVGNDTDESWVESVPLRRHAVDGMELASQLVEIAVPPRTTATYPLSADVSAPGDVCREFLVAGDAAGAVKRAWWWFAEDVDVEFPAPCFRTDVVGTADGYAVTVTAESLVKEVSLFPDRLSADAVVDDVLVSLLPGESHTFRITTEAQLEIDSLIRSPVLRSTSELCHHAPESENL
ncbi:MAG: glycoside hydrolase family 2 protein [Arachnia sp.]